MFVLGRVIQNLLKLELDHTEVEVLFKVLADDDGEADYEEFMQGSELMDAHGDPRIPPNLPGPPGDAWGVPVSHPANLSVCLLFVFWPWVRHLDVGDGPCGN